MCLICGLDVNKCAWTRSQGLLRAGERRKRVRCSRCVSQGSEPDCSARAIRSCMARASLAQCCREGRVIAEGGHEVTRRMASPRAGVWFQSAWPRISLIQVGMRRGNLVRLGECSLQSAAHPHTPQDVHCRKASLLTSPALWKAQVVL